MPRHEWEDTRSCPGSCPGSSKSARRLLKLHQRHSSDPGSLNNNAQLREVITQNDVTQCSAPSHWDELFEPGRHLNEPQDEIQTGFSIKYVLSMRPHGMLGYALFFTVIYVAYALYVTITKVRYCKPRPLNMPT